MEKTERAREFDRILENPSETIPGILADDICTSYPYFLPAGILRLTRSSEPPGPDAREALIARMAAAFPDRNALFDLAGDTTGEFAGFYPDENQAKPAMTTNQTIDHFLETFGGDSEQEIKALEQRIFNPVPDYAQILAMEEEKSSPDPYSPDGRSASENEQLVDRFIAKSKEKNGRFPTDIADNQPESTPARRPETPDTQSEPSDNGPRSEGLHATQPAHTYENPSDSLLSESLAKIYIRRHRYEKALEIIQSLSLNFPEKSIYFADQIRFLKKLIENEKYKQKKQ